MSRSASFGQRQSCYTASGISKTENVHLRSFGFLERGICREDAGPEEVGSRRLGKMYAGCVYACKHARGCCTTAAIGGKSLGRSAPTTDSKWQGETRTEGHRCRYAGGKRHAVLVQMTPLVCWGMCLLLTCVCDTTGLRACSTPPSENECNVLSERERLRSRMLHPAALGCPLGIHGRCLTALFGKSRASRVAASSARGSLNEVR